MMATQNLWKSLLLLMLKGGGLREAGGGNGGEVYLEVCPVRMREMDYLKAGCSQIAQRPSI